MKQRPTTVYVRGDGNLVQEFMRAMGKQRFRVIGAINGGAAKPVPDGFRRSTAIPRSVDIAVELSQDAEAKMKNLRELDRRLPSTTTLLSSSVLVPVAMQSTWIRHPHRLIGFCAFPTLLGKPLTEVAVSVHTSAGALAAARSFLESIGKSISVVQDRVGMVMPRILCMIINEAAFALSEQIATPEDIDTAMKLGTNYPDGPIAWGDKIGFEQVHRLLLALHADLGEDRYRSAPLLRQLALGHRWWVA